jgi:NAD-dependent deacetylase
MMAIGPSVRATTRRRKWRRRRCIWVTRRYYRRFAAYRHVQPNAALLAACRIPRVGLQMGVSLKPYVLLFDEYYTDLYRMTEAEAWMNGASRMVFMGPSFSVNIKAFALRVAVQRGIPVEIVDPEPIDLAASFGIPAGMADISYRRMKAQAWVVAQG